MSEEINSDLTRVYEEHEIKEALMQMSPLKALGPDGMSSIFYQRYWSTVCSLVTHVVLHVLNLGKIASSFNHTHAVLIPKKKNPVVVGYFCPISMCNVMYKIISKVIANRFKKVAVSSNFLMIMHFHLGPPNHRQCADRTRNYALPAH